MKTLAPAKPVAPSTTEQRWRERIAAWRESGLTADEFAEAHDVNAGTLRWWSSRLGRKDAPRFVRVVPRTQQPPLATDLTIEIGAARIRVANDLYPFRHPRDRSSAERRVGARPPASSLAMCESCPP